MFQEILNNVRSKTPLIHNITNYVTVNDCANILLACGASPIMADDILEAEEITSVCAGLNINIGTLNQRTVQAMLAAGIKSNELGHPVILDPVGAGASSFRSQAALRLINEIQFSVIRGNISEIKALALGTGSTKGVDADINDKITDSTLDETAEFIKSFARKMGAVIAVTGATDIVADAEKAYIIKNGVPTMSAITGSGCMLTAMAAAYIAANPGNMLEASAAAVCAMGLCGEKAFDTMQKNNAGNSSFRNYLIDEVFKLDGQTLAEGAKYEII